MPSAQEIINSSMKIIGALAQNETPNSSESDDGLIALNDMLASWSTDRTYIYTIAHNNFPLVANQTVYTIGPTGSYVATRPTSITNAYVRINGSDFSLIQINPADYSSIVNKDVSTGVPIYYYYEPSFPNGTLTLWGGPESAYDLYYDSWTALDEFPDLTTQVEFPPGYYRALRYGLAMEIAPQYGMSLSPEAMKIAMDSQANIRNLNLPDPIMKTEVGYLTGNYGWNFYRGY
jgi:hypothetical protein